MLKSRTTIAIVGLLAASLTLAACSTGGIDAGGGASSSVPPSNSSARFNDADISFAMAMVVHHQQAIDMAQLVLDKKDINPRVTTLAKDIKAAQGPEIEKMNSWLKDWGSSSTGMSGMDNGGMLMSDGDMAALKAANGVPADKLFLQQMTIHHKGAIGMATTELKDGKNPDALALAQTIIDAQTAEIAQMSDILATL